MMSNFSAVISCLFTIFTLTTAINVTKCFLCDSAGQATCLDPFNEALNSARECSGLNYPDTRSFDVLRIIQQEEKTVGSNFTFVCIKLTVQNGNTTSLIRSCGKQVDSMASYCDFAEREADRNSTYNLLSCNSCDTEECNTGALHQVSAILLGVVLFFASAF